jgi:hypothetical protein
MFRVCKVGGIVSILVPLKNFEDKDLEKLQEVLHVKGFSQSALRMWHRSATKMSLDEIDALFQGYEMDVVEYLSGMIGTFTVRKKE